MSQLSIFKSSLKMVFDARRFKQSITRGSTRVSALNFLGTRHWSWIWIFFGLTLVGRGEDFQVTPQQWSLELLKQAKPGDRFILQPGIYKMNWKIKNLAGTIAMPISIASEDVRWPASFMPTGGSLGIENCGFLILDGIHVEGQLDGSSIASLSIRRCKIRRNSDWRWFNNVIQLHDVKKVELDDSTFESLGMHTSILEAIDCDEISLNRCFLHGQFQQGIFVHNKSRENRDAISVAVLNRTVITGGEFALMRAPTVQWVVKQCSFLHQKKDLFRWAGVPESDGDGTPKIVFKKNIVIHRLNEIIDITKSASSPPVFFDPEDSFDNIWYCLDRPRLNPARLRIPRLPGTQHSVIPNPEILQGKAFLDDAEADRIKKAFDVFEKREGAFFWGYLSILLALTVFAISSHVNGTPIDAITEKLQYWSPFFQSHWWHRVAVLLLALCFFLIYSIARFAPFELTGSEVFTLEHWRNRWSVADRSNAPGQNLLLLLLGFGFTNLVSMGLSRSVRMRIVAAILCVSAIVLVDVLDFFVFSGFAAPGLERVAFISIGAMIAIVSLSYFSSSNQQFNIITKEHFIEMKWVDIASVIGVFLTMLYAWYPLELQVNPRAMLEKLEGEKVAILPFQKKLRLFDASILVWHGILVGVAIGRFLRFRRHRIRLAVGWIGMFWLAVEGIKIVFPNRALSMDHVFWSLAGSGFGLLIAHFLDKTPNLLDFPSVLSFRQIVRWAIGFTWIALPLWVDFGWYHFWYLTK